MSDNGLFILGAVIFIAYMVGLLHMINQQHKIQSRRPSEGGKTQRKDEK